MGLPLKIIKRTFGTSDWQLAREATPFPARLQLGDRGQQSSIHGPTRKIDPAAGLPKSPIHLSAPGRIRVPRRRYQVLGGRGNPALSFHPPFAPAGGHGAGRAPRGARTKPRQPGGLCLHRAAPGISNSWGCPHATRRTSRRCPQGTTPTASAAASPSAASASKRPHTRVVATKEGASSSPRRGPLQQMAR
jgi:hypothetical protein